MSINEPQRNCFEPARSRVLPKLLSRTVRARETSAFSLVEILVVMALLSVIVLGLMAMFNQTQRAFRLGMTQTDVLESGRIATELLTRELRQMTPSDQYAVNFYSVIANPPGGYSGTPNSAIYSFSQVLPGTAPPNRPVMRTNILQAVYFLTRRNQTWTGVGYYVSTDGGLSSIGPVGTLYRFETNGSTMQLGQNIQRLYSTFNNLKPPPLNGSTNVSKILDGVVQFRIRAYDNNGNWMTQTVTNIDSVTGATNWINVAFNPAVREVSQYIFTNNAVPASVELEIGVLEQQTFEKYKSLPTYAAQTNFLAQQAAHVHLFRQRIPIPNVDSSAYP